MSLPWALLQAPHLDLLQAQHLQIKLPLEILQSDSISRQVKLWLVFYCYSTSPVIRGIQSGTESDMDLFRSPQVLSPRRLGTCSDPLVVPRLASLGCSTFTSICDVPNLWGAAGHWKFLPAITWSRALNLNKT